MPITLIKQRLLILRLKYNIFMKNLTYLMKLIAVGYFCIEIRSMPKNLY